MRGSVNKNSLAGTGTIVFFASLMAAGVAFLFAWVFRQFSDFNKEMKRDDKDAKGR